MTDLLTPTTMAGRTVTPLGLGTARLGAVWQRRGLRAGLATVHTALDLGVTLVDTADCYARGISERIVGRAVGARDDVVVMTKVGLLKTPLALRDAAAASGRRASFSGLRQGPESDRSYHPDYLRSAARACLRRQGREALDVLLLHEPGAGDLNPEVAAAMDGLVTDGLVRQWGASVRDVDAALAAIALPGLSWLQVPVNAGDTSVADALADHPRERDVAVIALGALGDGTLLPHATSVATPPHAIATLTEAAAAPSPVDGVLLGMSTPEHAVANISALQAGTPDGVADAITLAVKEPA
ncbi:oxidoreductase, aryl-alcohol dehydrogenase like protein [Janibacter hoylei PVAS-1]|uniref:Aldo/keto reductase n=1 Tax=Janibacter hoylei PVAS-1 TaxID=1210046 RepID=K1E2X8_9MICO|nr:aldo/keto reductase [Janibacter hoylei]EKA61341.1 oxidoreductase, aryl-alcohol dehydrogenase like protein [Janibacter hoylei PVAS-1]RWU84469.1 aldo/keto reductase [Janibacter hoylei PVAS-1]